MADKGIIFSAPMVRALLEGRKTQTRRLLKNAPHGAGWHCDPADTASGYRFVANGGTPAMPCVAPYAVGDRLYVREACNTDFCEQVLYRADGGSAVDAGYAREPKWRPSIHMPRSASRLWLQVTDVRVQRLQAISEADAIAESCAGCLGANPDFPDEWDPSPREEFRDLWNSLHGKEGERWQDNPWIVAVSFEVHHGNIDAETE